ncbi:MAG: phosphatase PAP2 family protein [Streptomyces sp.]|nr:phosphatase PAP2 family protein [Streptomyces sp.]NUR02270.1 phosphatase PAP2 family protein [Streptomyces sp.]
MTATTGRRVKWQYPVVAVVAVAAAAFGLVRPLVTADATPAASAKTKLSATDRVKQNPPPALFTDTQIADIAKQLTAEKHTADTLFAQWKKAHGTTRDDHAFTTWAEAHIPAPPSSSARAAELKQVQTLARTRTPAGKKAATWLEVYGKKDIWKVYLHDQRELLPAAAGTTDKAQLKAAFTLSKTITKRLVARYNSPAPYVLDTSLRPEKHIKAGAKCPCSYPSKHGALSATAVTYLSNLNPHRAAEYQWMAAEIAYSRLYMAGHLPSDILAGALLGDLVGEYVLTTGGHSA